MKDVISVHLRRHLLITSACVGGLFFCNTIFFDKLEISEPLPKNTFQFITVYDSVWAIS